MAGPQLPPSWPLAGCCTDRASGTEEDTEAAKSGAGALPPTGPHVTLFTTKALKVAYYFILNRLGGPNSPGPTNLVKNPVGA